MTNNTSDASGVELFANRSYVGTTSGNLPHSTLDVHVYQVVS